MVPKNLEIAGEDFWTRRNSSGAFSHSPPPLAARGFTRRRNKNHTTGGVCNGLFLSSISCCPSPANLKQHSKGNRF